MRSLDLCAETLRNACPIDQIDQDRKLALDKGIPEDGQIRLGNGKVRRVAQDEIQVAPGMVVASHSCPRKR